MDGKSGKLGRRRKIVSEPQANGVTLHTTGNKSCKTEKSKRDEKVKEKKKKLLNILTGTVVLRDMNDVLEYVCFKLRTKNRKNISFVLRTNFFLRIIRSNFADSNLEGTMVLLDYYSQFRLTIISDYEL